MCLLFRDVRLSKRRVAPTKRDEASSRASMVCDSGNFDLVQASQIDLVVSS